MLAILLLLLFCVFAIDSSKTFLNNPVGLIIIITISAFSILTEKYYPTLYISIKNIMHFIQDSIFILLFIYSPLLLLMEWIKNTFIKFNIIDLQALDNTNIDVIFACLFILMIFINRPITLIVKSYMQLKNPEWEQYEPSLGRAFILFFILISIIFSQYIKIYTPLDLEKHSVAEIELMREYFNAFINIVFLMIIFLVQILDLAVSWYFLKKKYNPYSDNAENR